MTTQEDSERPSGREAGGSVDAKRKRCGGAKGKTWVWVEGDLDRIRADFPSIAPKTLSGTEYEGFINLSAGPAALGRADGAGDSLAGAWGQPSYWVHLSGLPPISPSGPRGRGNRGCDGDGDCAESVGCLGPPYARTDEGVCLRVCATLASVLDGANKAPVVRRRMAGSRSLHGFLLELRDIVEKVLFADLPCLGLSGEGETRGEATLGGFLRLAAEARACSETLRTKTTLGTLSFLSKDLLSMEYKTKDALGRDHALCLRLPPTYPDTGPPGGGDTRLRAFVALPVAFDPLETSAPRRAHGEANGLPSAGAGAGAGGLAGIFRRFQDTVASLDPFWTATAALDEDTWVLEPEPEAGSAKRVGFDYRRILVDRHVSMILTFCDPTETELGPSNPRVTFLGPRARVEAMEERVAAFWANREQRDPLGSSVVAYLEEMLGQVLPRRPRQDGTQGEEETHQLVPMCGICYDSGLRTGKTIPNVTCENPKCTQVYHDRCLLEWLQSDQTSRQVFSKIFGACPYCSDPIVCKLLGNC